MVVRKIAHPSIDERKAMGAAARDKAPPSSHVKWPPSAPGCSKRSKESENGIRRRDGQCTPELGGSSRTDAGKRFVTF